MQDVAEPVTVLLEEVHDAIVDLVKVCVFQCGVFYGFRYPVIALQSAFVLKLSVQRHPVGGANHDWLGRPVRVDQILNPDIVIWTSSCLSCGDEEVIAALLLPVSVLLVVFRSVVVEIPLSSLG